VRSAARLSLAVAVLVLAGCGSGKSDGGSATRTTCRTTGKDVAFPILGASRPHTVVVRTSQGSFTIRLDVQNSPCTSSSFASLVRRKFFDGTTFHRIVPGFVIQGGDPTASGTGGPGYTVVEAPPQNALYTRGVVAMAKSQDEPPGASGSQFFVVTGDNIGLPPDYAILGAVTKGLPVVLKIGKLGDPATEEPTKKVDVLSMTLSPT
jgi:cyclophilin family peptidyl-prolyl cis-trans isomerase